VAHNFLSKTLLEISELPHTSMPKKQNNCTERILNITLVRPIKIGGNS